MKTNAMQADELVNLSNEQLLSASLRLVDKTSTQELNDCYENVFAESIKKYLLKVVIKQEIEEICKLNIDDWKRVSLINKIKKLTPGSSNFIQTNVRNVPLMPVSHLTPVSFSPQTIDLTFPSPPPHDINNLTPLNHLTFPSSPPHEFEPILQTIDKSETSTDYILMHGYIRNEMNIKNNHYFPKDILSVCQTFIGDCSNIINDKELIVFNHTSNTYKCILNNKHNSTQNIWSSTELKKLSSPNINKKLILPYKVLFYNDKKSWICDTFPHRPDVIDITANMQQIGTFQFGNSQTHAHQIPPHYSTHYSNKKKKSGVVQYLDVNKSRLLNFGGIESDNNYSHSYQNNAFTPCKQIYSLNLNQARLDINSFDSPTPCPKLVSTKLKSAPLFISNDENTVQTSSVPMAMMDAGVNTAINMTIPDIDFQVSPVTIGNIAGPEWIHVNSMIYSRGYMSLCEVNNSKLAIIGGKTYTIENFRAYNSGHSYYYGGHINNYDDPTYKSSVMDCVELYDLNYGTGSYGNNCSIPIKNLNHKRMGCGCYYNKFTDEIIVFGGRDEEYAWKNPVSCIMEIYDFHKNIWIDVPYCTNKKYGKYPLVWTVGNKCIFVAKCDRNQLECEWIDLRVCDKHGKNKSKWNSMQSIHINGSSINNNYTVFMK